MKQSQFNASGIYFENFCFGVQMFIGIIIIKWLKEAVVKGDYQHLSKQVTGSLFMQQ